MSNKIEKDVANVAEEVVETFDPNTVYATIIKDENGDFHVVDFDGTVGPVCKFCDENDKTIALTKNKSNRQWFNRAKAEEIIAEKGKVELFYKAAKHVGSVSNKIPNEKLISYLSEEEQAEYKAIIERAKKARDDAKAKPMTEMEKAQAKLERAKKAYEKLLAESNSEATDNE